MILSPAMLARKPAVYRLIKEGSLKGEKLNHQQVAFWTESLNVVGVASREDFVPAFTEKLLVPGCPDIILLGYGIIGAYVLRSGFATIASWEDAVYFTIVTFSTLGYGDIVPVTEDARWFTLSMVVVGLVSFVTALSVLVGPMWENRIREVFSLVEGVKQKDHVILCGQGAMAEGLLEQFIHEQVPCVVLARENG